MHANPTIPAGGRPTSEMHQRSGSSACGDRERASGDPQKYCEPGDLLGAARGKGRLTVPAVKWPEIYSWFHSLKREEVTRLCRKAVQDACRVKKDVPVEEDVLLRAPVDSPVTPPDAPHTPSNRREPFAGVCHPIVDAARRTFSRIKGRMPARRGAGRRLPPRRTMSARATNPATDTGESRDMPLEQRRVRLPRRLAGTRAPGLA
jgi:hypothetical protein